MKLKFVFVLFIIAALLMCKTSAHAQADSNWTQQQLMPSATLATIIKTNPDSITIISVGPFNSIPGTINIGMTSKPENLEKLKTKLSTLDKSKKIVVYCGCCPFEHCPNIRPAIQTLKDMSFTNYYLLDLSHNIKINWIDEGYPVTTQ